MSEQKQPEDAQSSSGEPFLERWSRRKADVKAGLDVEPDPPAESPAPAAAPGNQGQAPVEVELPDLDSLHADSDYSAFMTPGVDDILRRKALRKLFSSPKFNVLDGLDDYCGDYTKFEGLGDIVTADMKHHIERVARAAAKALEETGQGDQPAAPAVTPAIDDQADEVLAEQQKEDHDGPDRPA